MQVKMSRFRNFIGLWLLLVLRWLQLRIAGIFVRPFLLLSILLAVLLAVLLAALLAVLLAVLYAIFTGSVLPSFSSCLLIRIRSSRRFAFVLVT